MADGTPISTVCRMLTSLEPDDPRVLGEFRLTGRLGEGGQGIVYLGLSPDGDQVAVKVIKGGLDPAVRSRLARELDAMRSVATFCTARVLTASIDGREPYVVSEFIDGPSLQHRVATSGPLRGGELERLAVGTATALAAVHSAGIIHRDLKPANVLLGPDGPRVVDFGIARQGESDTMTAGPVGTPAYLAPEQIAGQPASPASDVFAWGATIVYAATGRPAFGADSVAAVMHRIMTVTPDVSGVPEPLRATVERCLSKDPADRPTSRDLLLGLVGSTPDPLRAGAVAAREDLSAGLNVAGPTPPGAGTGSHVAGPIPSGAERGAGPYTTGPIPPGAGTEGGPYTTGPTPRGAGTGSGPTPPGVRGPVATGPASEGNAQLTTDPGGRRGARTGLLTGVGVAVIALAVSGVLLWPRISAIVGTATTTSSATPTATSPAGAATAGSTPTTGPTEEPSARPTEKPAPAAEPGSETIPAAFAGTWKGHIIPTPAGMTGEYDIRIKLESGKDTGRWFEPANSCEGTLTLSEATNTALTFSLTNAGQCVPGTVTLTRKGSGLAYQWNDDLGLLTYNGDLTKTG